MTKRITFASFSLAFVLGAGALLGGAFASATSAEAKPGWHGDHGHHGHLCHGFRSGRHWGGHGGWGYRRVGYSGFHGGRCFTVLRAGFVPCIGYVERPVTLAADLTTTTSHGSWSDPAPSPDGFNAGRRRPRAAAPA